MTETLDVDVLFVGAGPANLSAAIHLMDLVTANNGSTPQGPGTNRICPKPNIAIIEKAAGLGMHSVSGAVLKTCALEELLPDYLSKNPPIEGEVKNSELFFLTKTGHYRIPVVPDALKNKNCLIISLCKFVKWLGTMAEDKGAHIFTGCCGTSVLYDGDRITGVKTGELGINKNGDQKPNHQAGININSKVTVFGEGSRGTLYRDLDKKYALCKPEFPQVYEVGVKEVFQVPVAHREEGTVIHMMGWPFEGRDVGGAFVYYLSHNLVVIGLALALNTKDPLINPHAELQRFKRHPFVSSLLGGGKPLSYGAKTIPCGGFHTVPQLAFDGGLIVGDSASFLNSYELKGIHLAMKSGILAAKTIFQALLHNRFSKDMLSCYTHRVNKSYIFEELHKHRHFRQIYKGDVTSLGRLGLQRVFGEPLTDRKMGFEADFKATAKVKSLYKNPKFKKYCDIKYDNAYFLDKLTDVYHSGCQHNEDQPVHLKIVDPSVCSTKCRVDFNNPCTHFCPANVYRMEEQNLLKLDSTNCLHCKTCEIKCPFQNVSFTLPEAGGGPRYTVC